MPVTKGATEKLGIVLSSAPAGLATTFERFAVDGVSSGGVRSLAVIFRITPGASLCQSP
jgi:hypothetical protein